MSNKRRVSRRPIVDARNHPTQPLAASVRCRRGRAGFMLVEMILALVLAGVIAAAAAASLHNATRVARAAADRAERADALRTTAAVLRDDLAATAGADAFLDRDSVRLRVFRGVAIACDTVGADAIVRFRGARQPDLEKDSVLVLTSGESVRPLAASAEAAEGCALAAGESRMRWAVNDPPRPGTLLLLFETGTYTVGERALRYRRGAGGRQPLTAEVFGSGSGFAVEAHALGVNLEPVPRNADMGAVRLRVPLRNPRSP